MFRRVLLACVLGGGGGTLGAEDGPRVPPLPTPAEVRSPVAGTGQLVSPVAPSSRPASEPAAVAPPPAPLPTQTQPSLSTSPAAPSEPGKRVWVSADYLLWSVQSGRTPPLVVSDLPGTARVAVGIPTTPGQRVLAGDSGLNGDLRSGFRISGGFWSDSARRWGLEGDYFFLGADSESGTFASTGVVPLARPFFNVITGQPDAELVAFPAVLSGSVRFDARNTFSGAGAFLRRNLYRTCDPCAPTDCRLDLRVGYRHFDLNDTLQVRENLTTTGQGPVPLGTRLVVTDRFRTENTFDGGLLGLAGDVRRGNWSVDFRSGVSLGNLHRVLTVDGNTVVAVPGQPAVTRVGGLLAQRSNVGRYASDEFTVVPEVGLNLGCQLTPGLRAFVGYTLIYLPNTWRAGDQIDRAVDPTQLAGAVSAFGRPAVRLASTGTAVQGINFGLLLRY